MRAVKLDLFQNLKGKKRYVFEKTCNIGTITWRSEYLILTGNKHILVNYSVSLTQCPLVHALWTGGCNSYEF